MLTTGFATAELLQRVLVTIGLRHPGEKPSQDQLSFRRLLRIGNKPRSDADLMRCALPPALSTLLLMTPRTMPRSVIASYLLVGHRCVVSRIPPSARKGPRGAPVATGQLPGAPVADVVSNVAWRVLPETASAGVSYGCEPS